MPAFSPFSTALLVFGLLLLAPCGHAREDAASAPNLLDDPLETLDGRQVRLSDYEGKWVIVVFWASWCGPCRREIPHFKRLEAAYGGRDDFQIIALSVEEEDEPLREFVETLEIPWPVVRLGARDREAFSASFKVKSIPHIALLGPDGRVAHRRIRGQRLDKELESVLQPEEDTAARRPSSASRLASSR